MSNILHKTDTARPNVLVNVADNLRRLRRNAGLSQSALAEAAGVSRRMIVNIEKGDVNVSLNTLDRLAEALGVVLHDFIARPDAIDTARVDELVWVGQAEASQARMLASRRAHSAVELWVWSLTPGDSYGAAADPAGWTNMVVVIEGLLTIELGDERVVVTAGDFHVFTSDCRHRFLNAGDDTVRFVRNVVY